jgi:iron complex outermembrane receptor protein
LKQNHNPCLILVLAIACFAPIYLISSACNLYAQQQESSASISGTVVDSKGVLVRDAVVIMKNQTTGAVNQTNADNVGHFAVTGIPSGRYTLIVNAKGFASTTQKRDASLGAHSRNVYNSCHQRL